MRAWLEARGAAALDADLVVHDLLANDRGLIEAIAARFGTDVLGAEGIQRSALAAKVFAGQDELRALEALVHPAVRARVSAWLAAREGGVAVVEAVRLVESEMAGAYDAVWLVTCRAAERRRRLASRGWSASEIARRMAAGSPPVARLAAADVVIDNSGPWSATEAQLRAAWRGLADALTDPKEEV